MQALTKRNCHLPSHTHAQVLRNRDGVAAENILFLFEEQLAGRPWPQPFCWPNQGV